MPWPSVVDLEERLGRSFTDAQAAAQADALLRDVIGAVTAYTGQQILTGERTDRIKVRGGKVRFPQRHVTAVESITDMDGNPVTFTWHAGPTAVLDQWNTEPWYVDVTYTAGYDDVPDAIVGLICQITNRAIGTPADSSGVSGETIGIYSYTIGDAAASGPFGVTDPEMHLLNSIRSPAAPISML